MNNTSDNADNADNTDNADNADQGSDCTICLDLCSDESATSLPRCNCKTKMHNHCLFQWLRQRMKRGEHEHQHCEICRAPYFGSAAHLAQFALTQMYAPALRVVSILTLCGLVAPLY